MSLTDTSLTHFEVASTHTYGRVTINTFLLPVALLIELPIMYMCLVQDVFAVVYRCKGNYWMLIESMVILGVFTVVVNCESLFSMLYIDVYILRYDVYATFILSLLFQMFCLIVALRVVLIARTVFGMFARWRKLLALFACVMMHLVFIDHQLFTDCFVIECGKLKGQIYNSWWAVVTLTTVGYCDMSPTKQVAIMNAISIIRVSITIVTSYLLNVVFAIESRLAECHDGKKQRTMKSLTA